MDTSVAIPLLAKSHTAHSVVNAWAAGRELRVSGHALAETYSVLTRLPGSARLAPGDAVELIEGNFAQPLVLSSESAQSVHQVLAHHGVAGGATYDGLVALAACEHDAVLATRDARARSTYEALGATVEIIGEPRH
ncbi:PIN domain-containing protein [Nesterenkonia muleiensis]|uniref:PIN domain-containing protein n=1 Tax=Nesterenkonia muleiensis TaxID=2282648 RepID=UPI001EE430EF|nr:PIN domain-containing protein [Nesterenkonia muleiensis]